MRREHMASMMRRSVDDVMCTLYGTTECKPYLPDTLLLTYYL